MLDQQEFESLKIKIEELQEKNEETLNNWKRTAADFENFKKRTETERKELVEFSKEITVMKLIPSLESLEQVLIYAPVDDKYKEWLTGLRATIQQLEKVMEELGVVKIKAVGQPFDHSLHEAVEEVEGTEGEIVKELQPGFMLNGKVIIPAKVAVGKKG
ncbi:MAG TPA: nucleotide exchange factor GrpE [Patescibacteria group bacterium]